MGRITSSIGIITGVPITDTVEQLIGLQARPRDLLVSRNKTLGSEQAAITDLTATIINLQFSVKNLSKETLYDAKTVASSDTSKLIATSSGGAVDGRYQFTPVQVAQSHQLISSGFSTLDQPIGAGTLKFRYGGFIDEAISLSQLNGGEGVSLGKIRITDRNGESATIDLRSAQTVDDVLNAINANDTIDVAARAVGDHIQLVDLSGQTLSNLRVQEVGGGTTAADLGLGQINVAADIADGNDVLRLHDNLQLNDLNGGNGLSIRKAVADLEVAFRDGSPNLKIEFNRLAQADGNATATTNAANGNNAKIKFTAVETGGEYDDVRIEFVAGAISAGQETVEYDESDPDNKVLRVTIAAGATTANNVIAAVQANSAVAAKFTAAKVGNGLGQVTVTDIGLTDGGGGHEARTETTLGDLLQTINEAAPNRLKAELSANGDRIVLTDLTAGAGTFSVNSALGGSLAEDLGLTGEAVDGVITSGRLLGGLKTSLLSNLNGGRGLGALGEIELTDRSGASATIDLSGAETLSDVTVAINAAGLGITATINKARTGIELEDTTGLSASNLKIASADATGTAEKLGIAADVAKKSFTGATLNLQVVSEQTRLSDYNGGQGVAAGSILITDSAGVAKAFTFGGASSPKTVGEVIDAINAATLGVEARINDTGDGIALIDTAGGDKKLRVDGITSTQTARNLHLFGESVEVEIDGQTRQVVDGSTTYEVTIEEGDSLTELVHKINELGSGVAANTFSESAGLTPHRFNLLSQVSGAAGELLIDTSQVSFSLDEIAGARDSLLLLGAADSAGVLVSSSNDVFDNVLNGVSLRVTGVATESVNVTVSQNNASLVSALEQLVTSYNGLRDKLGTLTAFNEANNATGPLFGSTEALRVDTEISRLFSSRWFGAGDIHSLEELGLSLSQEGKIELDTIKLNAKLNSDPEGVEEFFTTGVSGFAEKVDSLLEQMVGVGNSLLINRITTLQNRIEVNEQRIDRLSARLDSSRELLLTQFYNMESIIGKMQNDLSALSQIAALPPL